MQEQEKKKVLRRLKIIEGQVRGLQRMVEENAYCIDVITQTSAVRRALATVDDALLAQHLGHCALNQMKNGKEQQALAEIMKVYQLKRL